VALTGVGLPIREADAGPRTHPLLERWAAAVVVEQRREELERDACRAFLSAEPTAPLIVDGGLTTLAGAAGAERAIGVAKQHETQFLEGNDLAVALTLPAGSRSSIFRRETGGAGTHSWYLRLWPWTDEELLHGLVRVERLGPVSGDDADQVSRWLLAERAPIAGRDPRWDRLLYPLHEVETVLRAQAGGWL
jgi:hypothetical protein